MRQRCPTTFGLSRRLSLQPKLEPSRSPTVHQPAERCYGLHRTSHYTPYSSHADNSVAFTGQLPPFRSDLSPKRTNSNSDEIHSARPPLLAGPDSYSSSATTIFHGRPSVHHLSLGNPSAGAPGSDPNFLRTTIPSSQGNAVVPHHPRPSQGHPAGSSRLGSLRTQAISIHAEQPQYSCAVGSGDARGSGSGDSNPSAAPTRTAVVHHCWAPSSQPQCQQPLGQRAQHPGPTGSLPSTAAGQQRLVEDTTDDTWRMPLARPGSVVALGKFEALHRGHQALATTAAALAQDIAVRASAAAASTATDGGNRHRVGSQIPDAPDSGDASTSGRTACNSIRDDCTACGDGVLLSFSGMAAVLGWPSRLPLTAPQDRGRVLASWGEVHRSGGGGSSSSGEGCGPGGDVGGLTEPSIPPPTPLSPGPPRLRTLPFAQLRSLSPEAFVALLAGELGAAGVVAGRNYRFGYKAAGDADTLVRLGAQYGMRVEIVDLVKLPDSQSNAGLSDGASNTQAESDTRSASCRSSSSEGSVEGTAELPAARAAGDAFIGGLSTDMEVEDVGPLTAAASEARGGGPVGAVASSRGGGGGGGNGGCSQASSRVSSSRIRELLAVGAVGSVEQLLGRKYRLVALLRAESRAEGRAGGVLGTGRTGDSTTSQTPHDCSHSHNSRCTTPTTAIALQAHASVLATTTGRAFVPYSTYQNQPPANGNYRALVAVAAGWEVPIEEADAVTRVAGAGAESNHGSGGWFLGPLCTTITLSDDGMYVEPGVGEEVLRSCSERAGECMAEVPLLFCVDFDACN